MNACRIVAVVTVTFSLCTTGCGRVVGPNVTSVAGSVTLDGQPINDGTIVFVSAASGSNRSYAANIVDGKYEAIVEPGLRHVQITARRKLDIDRSTVTDEEELLEQYVPQEYNAQTRLSANIQADGAETYDFVLVSSKS